MFWNQQLVGYALKLFAWELVTAAEKRDNAKREQAALSSLLVCTRRENDCLTRCDKSRSLGVVVYHSSRLIIELCAPNAANGGEIVPNCSKGQGMLRKDRLGSDE